MPLTDALRIAMAILSLANAPSPARAEYFGQAISVVSGGDLDMAAALVVTGDRESGWRPEVERCELAGLGGMGAFQLGEAYAWSTRCGPIEAQARGARRALAGVGTERSPAETFGRFLGASGRHPEARRRAGLFWVTRERIRCACSV